MFSPLRTRIRPASPVGVVLIAATVIVVVIVGLFINREVRKADTRLSQKETGRALIREGCDVMHRLQLVAVQNNGAAYRELDPSCEPPPSPWETVDVADVKRRLDAYIDHLTLEDTGQAIPLDLMFAVCGYAKSVGIYTDGCGTGESPSAAPASTFAPADPFAPRVTP